MIHAFVTSKLDYCHSLLSGLSQNQIQRLQYVQNSAARLLTGTRKYDSITPILKELHWLPMAERIDFKILLLTFKSLHNMAPIYLRELLSPYIPLRTLRSSSKSSLVIPRCMVKGHFHILHQYYRLVDRILIGGCVRVPKVRSYERRRRKLLGGSGGMPPWEISKD